MKFRYLNYSLGPIKVGQTRFVNYPCPESEQRRYIGLVKITRKSSRGFDCEILKRSDHRFGIPDVFFNDEDIKQ